MLPDGVVQAMLRRELLLTRAKLHALTYEHIMGERKMRAFKSQLKQARCTGPRRAGRPRPAAVLRAGRAARLQARGVARVGVGVRFSPAHGRRCRGGLRRGGRGC
jgi:hypothetical protein